MDDANRQTVEMTLPVYSVLSEAGRPANPIKLPIWVSLTSYSEPNYACRVDPPPPPYSPRVADRFTAFELGELELYRIYCSLSDTRLRHAFCDRYVSGDQEENFRLPPIPHCRRGCCALAVCLLLTVPPIVITLLSIFSPSMF